MPANPREPVLTRLPTLTGIRFIAAFLVFLFHFAFEFPFRNTTVGTDYLKVVGQAGPLGVGFFFVLSGFVLTWTARSGEGSRDFWRRRAAKIYPNHLTIWVVTLGLMLWAGQTVAWSSAVPNSFLLHPWFPDQKIFFSMDDVTWSLGCEVLFYLMFPLFFRVLAKVRDEWLWPAAGLVAVLVVVAIPLVGELLPNHPLFMGTPALPLWFVYIFPPVRALDFIAGMIMARIVQSGRWIPLGLMPAIGLLAAGYVVSNFVPPTFSFTAATFIPVILLIPAGATADLRGKRSPLRGRIMIWLGEISFAFYLVHRLVLQYGRLALGANSTWATPVVVGLAVLALAVALLLSWLLHTLVENPAMRKFGRRRQPVRVIDAASPAGEPQHERITDGEVATS